MIHESTAGQVAPSWEADWHFAFKEAILDIFQHI
jgi:hypothetical protein